MARSWDQFESLRTRSQSDNYYVTIIVSYGFGVAPDLSGGGRGAQFFACRREGAPDAAGSEPGGPAPRGRPRRAAVRPIVQERHTDRRGSDPAELRSASRAPGRRDRV